MPIFEIINKIPLWYLGLALLISIYYGIRGIMEFRILSKQWSSYVNKESSLIERIMILYIQDFLFKFITTMSGFMALFVACYVFPSTTEIKEIGWGNVLLLIFLFIWGIIGIGGYLTHLIATGKFPQIK